MVKLSSGNPSRKKEGASNVKKSEMNRIDLRVYSKKLSSQEKTELEQSMRDALQKRMGEKRKEKLALIDQNKARTNARKTVNSEFIDKKQQEVQVKLEQTFSKGQRH